MEIGQNGSAALQSNVEVNFSSLIDFNIIETMSSKESGQNSSFIEDWCIKTSKESLAGPFSSGHGQKNLISS